MIFFLLRSLKIFGPDLLIHCIQAESDFSESLEETLFNFAFVVTKPKIGFFSEQIIKWVDNTI